MSRRIEPGPGQESVWDYPRPPRVEASERLVKIELGGEVIAESRRAKRVLETSHPPTWYLPPEDFREGVLELVPGRSFCEFKGAARYFNLVGGGKKAEGAAWSYPDPEPGFEAIRDHIAVYPSKVDACWVDDERVEAQEGDFYGGWVTPDVVGPFKGPPGTMFW